MDYARNVMNIAQVQNLLQPTPQQSTQHTAVADVSSMLTMVALDIMFVPDTAT